MAIVVVVVVVVVVLVLIVVVGFSKGAVPVLKEISL